MAAATWSVTLAISGGMAGVRRTVAVSSIGAWQVSDDRIGRSARGALESEQTDHIGGLVMGSAPLEAAPMPDCADCFQYDITIQNGARKTSRILNDLSLESSGIEDLITELVTLGNQALAQ